MACYQQKVSKIEMLQEFGIRANEIYQQDFLKVADLNRSTKEQWPAPFVEQAFHGLLSAESEQNWNASAIWNKS